MQLRRDDPWTGGNCSLELVLLDCQQQPADNKKSVLFQLPGFSENGDVFELHSGESASYSSRLDEQPLISPLMLMVLKQNLNNPIFCITMSIPKLMDLWRWSDGYVLKEDLRYYISLADTPAQPSSNTSSVLVSG